MTNESDGTSLLAGIKKEVEKDTGVDESKEFLNESFMRVGWKKKIILFLIFLLVCSTMFINDIIGKISPNLIYDQRSTNNNGTAVQGIMLVLIYSLMESLVNNKVL
jgi:hypothetical protein